MVNHNNRAASFMKEYDNHLSDGEILHRLCRMRVKEAETRREQLRFCWAEGWNTHLAQLRANRFLPSRRDLNSYLPLAGLLPDKGHRLEAAYYAAGQSLAYQNPPAEWQQHLQALQADIRARANGNKIPMLARPTLMIVPKEHDRARQRLIARYALPESILCGLTFAYLQAQLDPVFTDTSLAFRIKGHEAEDPRTAALRQIIGVRDRHENSPLWCAEVDIQSFYDCVDPQVAWDSIQRVSVAAQQCLGRTIDPRSLNIVRAYLDSYSFTESATAGAKRNWPDVDLRKLHGGELPTRLGIPQGGALSCLLVNCVLDLADERVKAAAAAGKELIYLRYCDDVIIISTDREVTAQALRIYLQTLQELRLPAHPCFQPNGDDAAFWKAKSRDVYAWGIDRAAGEQPWIGFLGYQVRRDGLLRIRPGTIEKQRARITSIADETLKSLGYKPGRIGEDEPKQWAWKRSPESILVELHRRLTALGTGLWASAYDTERQQRDQCWSGAFKLLQGRPFVAGPLKDLDRHRERQLRRVARRLGINTTALPLGDSRSSYHGQFVSHLNE
jgi:hypothetical protein